MGEQNKINVAIIGAGVAGMTLLRALLPYPQIDAHLYEARSELSNTGGAIALQGNATRSLEAISPQLLDVLARARAVSSTARNWVACGRHAGQRIVMTSDTGSTGIHSDTAKFFNVSRQAFLFQLHESLPTARVHMGKKLERTDELSSGQTQLSFADGSNVTAHVVIGADGIHSQMRGLVLGDDANTPEYAGWWYHVSILPLHTVQQVLGPDRVNPSDPQAHARLGERGTFITHDFVDGCDQVQCGFTVRGDGHYDPKETRPYIDRKQILQEYRNWPKEFGVDFVNMVCDESGDPLRCWPLTQHPAAPSFVSGNMAVMGDAAHSSTPWQGSGASMAIEDALVLSAVLGLVKSAAEVPAALYAYDATRRPRCQRVVESSHQAGMLSTGRSPAGLDKYKLAEALGASGSFIGDFDPAQHCAGAVALMRERLDALESLEAPGRDDGLG